MLQYCGGKGTTILQLLQCVFLRMLTSHYKGQHIRTFAAVVVPWSASLHRVLYLMHLHACCYGFLSCHTIYLFERNLF